MTTGLLESRSRIRPARPQDAPPEEQRATFAAELDGRLIGWAAEYRNIMTSQDGVGEISLLHVDPDHRRRGVGGALLAAALTHLERIGVRRVRAWAQEESAGFARRKGFQLGARAQCSRLDLGVPPVVPSLPGGVRVIPVADLEARQLFRADQAATADEPGDVPVGQVSYPAWRPDIWDNVDLAKDLSTAVLIGDEVVAFSLAVRDGSRMWSDLLSGRADGRRRGPPGLNPPRRPGRRRREPVDQRVRAVSAALQRPGAHWPSAVPAVQFST